MELYETSKSFACKLKTALACERLDYQQIITNYPRSWLVVSLLSINREITLTRKILKKETATREQSRKLATFWTTARLVSDQATPSRRPFWSHGTWPTFRIQPGRGETKHPGWCIMTIIRCIGGRVVWRGADSNSRWLEVAPRGINCLLPAAIHNDCHQHTG